MSESDTQIRKLVVDDDDDDGIVERGEPSGPPHARLQDKKKKKKISFTLARKAKRVILFPFKQARIHFITPRTRTNLSNNAPSTPHCRFPGKRAALATCFCFSRQPPILDPPAESTTSDPDDPGFTFDMLKALIEKNDFYSKECNPHL